MTKKVYQYKDEFEQEVFEYLDDLRDSAVTNMFDVGHYVREDFGVSRNEARELCKKWRNTFSERHPQS